MLVSVVRRPRARGRSASSPWPTRSGSAASCTTALERLYRDAPGADSIPGPADLAAWQGRFSEILDEVVAESDRPRRPAGGWRSRAFGSRSRPSSQPRPRARRVLRPRADLLERGFGFDEEDDEDDPGALPLGDFALRGPDRPDRRRAGRQPGGPARLQDLARRPGRDQDRQRGQAPAPALHARRARAPRPRADRRPLPAARRLRRPAAARACVLGARAARSGLFEGLDISVKGDALDDEEFEDALEEARRDGDRQRRADARRRYHAAIRSGGLLRVLHVPADLPPRARPRARGRERKRGRERR